MFFTPKWPHTPLHCMKWARPAGLLFQEGCSLFWQWVHGKVTVLLRVTSEKDMFTACSCFFKKGEEEHEYCSQRGHYRASHLTLLLSLSLFSGGRVSVCLWENRTPRSVYSISTGGRAFIPEITGMRVPLVYFLCRRHFTSHQRMQSNHTQPLTPLYTLHYHLLCNSVTVSLKHL